MCLDTPVQCRLEITYSANVFTSARCASYGGGDMITYCCTLAIHSQHFDHVLCAVSECRGPRSDDSQSLSTHSRVTPGTIEIHPVAQRCLQGDLTRSAALLPWAGRHRRRRWAHYPGFQRRKCRRRHWEWAQPPAGRPVALSPRRAADSVAKLLSEDARCFRQEHSSACMHQHTSAAAAAARQHRPGRLSNSSDVHPELPAGTAMQAVPASMSRTYVRLRRLVMPWSTAVSGGLRRTARPRRISGSCQPL